MEASAELPWEREDKVCYFEFLYGATTYVLETAKLILVITQQWPGVEKAEVDCRISKSNLNYGGNRKVIYLSVGCHASHF